MLQNTSSFKYNNNNNKSAENYDHDVDVVPYRKQNQVPQTKLVEKIKHIVHTKIVYKEAAGSLRNSVQEMLQKSFAAVGCKDQPLSEEI